MHGGYALHSSRGTIHVVVQAQTGKEFPDMRQNEREITLILEWETLLEQGPAQRRTDIEQGSLVHFYTHGTRSRIGVLWIIC